MLLSSSLFCQDPRGANSLSAPCTSGHMRSVWLALWLPWWLGRLCGGQWLCLILAPLSAMVPGLSEGLHHLCTRRKNDWNIHYTEVFQCGKKPWRASHNFQNLCAFGRENLDPLPKSNLSPKVNKRKAVHLSKFAGLASKNMEPPVKFEFQKNKWFLKYKYIPKLHGTYLY